MSLNILITGGAGFIGSRIKEKLLKKGYTVLSIGRNKKEDKIVDLLDCKSLSEAIKGFKPDIICHFASGSNISIAEANKEKEFKNVVLATNNLIECLKSVHGNKMKFIYLSSQAVYGVPRYLPVDETHQLIPLTFYGEVKIAVEDLIKVCGIDYIILRVSSAYGEGQDYQKSGAIAKFLNKMKQGKAPVIFNSQVVVCDFIYVDDVISAVMKAIENHDIKNEIFNVGSSKPIKLVEVLDILYKYFPYAPKPLTEQNALYPLSANTGLYLDIKKIKNKLGWECEYNIEKGLQQLLGKYNKALKN